MKALGIIAEYNPFHKGHLLHLEKSKQKTGLPVIAVMSGSLMQRGEPSFADKWVRARIAVECGVDLVLELPAVFSLQSAEHFANGGVKLLEATKLVSVLSCGAENPELNFAELGERISLPDAQAKLHELIATGISYAKACELALGSDTALAAKPNNILALEYAKALRATTISQLVLSREGSSYNDKALGELASATAIRLAYGQNGPWKASLPTASAELLSEYESKGFLGFNEEILWQLLSYKLWSYAPKDIAATTQCSEGLENLLHEALHCNSLAEAIAYCSNKRYPASRIRRLMLQLLLNKPRSYYSQSNPAYIRVLAFSENGRQLLSEMKHRVALPIITKLGKNPFQHQSEAFRQQLELDLAASNLAAFLRPIRQSFASDYISSPFYKRQ